MLEVADRRAFAQEFRIGDDGELRVRPRLADDALDLVAGADRHGRFRHDDGEMRQRLRDLARGVMDVGEIGMSVAAARRRADRDEDGIGLADRALQIGGERQPVLRGIARDQLLQAGLVDRHLALAQARDLAGVLVDADDAMSEIGKAGPRDEADIA